jgi:hypothetical protein
MEEDSGSVEMCGSAASDESKMMMAEETQVEGCGARGPEKRQ